MIPGYNENKRGHESGSANMSRAAVSGCHMIQGGDFLYKPKLERDIRCPLEYGLEIFGGKWDSRVICVLAALGTLRYSELRREMGNITDAVLASTLKKLITDEIIERKSYDEIPPRVEYSLSERGKTVVPILQSICQWAGASYRDDGKNVMVQCRKCDHCGSKKGLV